MVSAWMTLSMAVSTVGVSLELSASVYSSASCKNIEEFRALPLTTLGLSFLLTLPTSEVHSFLNSCFN